MKAELITDRGREMVPARAHSVPYEVTMVEVETALLERACAAIGVRTSRRVVELALRQVIRRQGWTPGVDSVNLRSS